MTNKSNTPANHTVKAYFLDEKEVLQQTELGSGIYNDIRNYGKLFVLAKEAGDHATISIPIPYLEAISPSELPKLNKVTHALSGNAAEKRGGIFEVVNVNIKQVGKVAEKVLYEMMELLKVKKPGRTLGHRY